MCVCVCVCVGETAYYKFNIPQTYCGSIVYENVFSIAVICFSLQTTQKAVALLQKRAKSDGWFLVRPNSRRPGYYALTLVYNSMPYHYEIVCEV